MKGRNHNQADGASLAQKDHEKSASLCEELEQRPREYQGKYVGIIRGRIVLADEDFTAVVRHLQRIEPDRSQHFVVLAGWPQPAEILNFGLV